MNIKRIEHSNVDKIDFNNIPFGRIFSDHMFMADYVNGHWQNPEIKPFGRIPMHPGIMALHYGQSIFEGMKATVSTDGTPLLFRPQDHIKRLNLSARRMCMPEFPKDLFMNALEELMRLDKDFIPPVEGSALYIRPLMYANDEHIGVSASDKYQMLIMTLPVGPYYSKPVKLFADKVHVRAVPGGVGIAKTAGNYAASLMPAQMAKNMGYDQVMWLDAKDHNVIQEVGTMNIFFIIDGEIITPELDGAILAGITRDGAIKYFRDEGYRVTEREITLEEVLDADADGTLQEVFGTGTAAVVAPVSLISDGDTTITLKPDNYTISRSYKKYIDTLRQGLADDKFGWLHPVDVEVAV